MANHKSAIKRIGTNEKQRIRNRTFRGRAKTFVKKARAALHKGVVADAETAIRAAVRDLDMAASRGTIHKRNAARRKSRLMRQLAALKAGK